MPDPIACPTADTLLRELMHDTAKAAVEMIADELRPILPGFSDTLWVRRDRYAAEVVRTSLEAEEDDTEWSLPQVRARMEGGS